MSDIAMSEKALAALANATESLLEGRYWGFEVPKSLRRVCGEYCLGEPNSAETIYRKLYALNVRAYNSRKQHQLSEVAPEVDINRYRIHQAPQLDGCTVLVFPWHYQLAKFLEDWICQTCAKPVLEHPLRLAMKEFRDNLYGFLVTHDSRYIASPDDLED